jgi:hypothetical protein
MRLENPRFIFWSFPHRLACLDTRIAGQQRCKSPGDVAVIVTHSLFPGAPSPLYFDDADGSAILFLE